LDQTVTIDVLGQPFTFKTDSNVSEARAVAEFVAKSVHEVQTQCGGQVPTPDKRAILILTALNITSELFDLKTKHQVLLEDINQRSAQLLNTLETQVQMKDARSSN
jgi:cell division protein ZapA (FtsZ GTPase activity inhibitor)